MLDRTRDYVKRQTGRQRARLRSDLIAGTKASRAASQKAAAAAREKLRTDGARLEAEISQLQEKLDELNRDATTKEKQVEAETKAVAGLRKYISPHIASTIDRLKGRANKRYASESRAAGEPPEND